MLSLHLEWAAPGSCVPRASGPERWRKVMGGGSESSGLRGMDNGTFACTPRPCRPLCLPFATPGRHLTACLTRSCSQNTALGILTLSSRPRKNTRALPNPTLSVSIPHPELTAVPARTVNRAALERRAACRGRAGAGAAGRVRVVVVIIFHGVAVAGKERRNETWHSHCLFSSRGERVLSFPRHAAGLGATARTTPPSPPASVTTPHPAAHRPTREPAP